VNRALQQDHARALQNNDTVNAVLINNLFASSDSLHLNDDGPLFFDRAEMTFPEQSVSQL